jgi:hypothetical protein
MIVMQVFSWQFRVLGNGTMESKNIPLQHDWAVRSASEVGLDASRYWYIKNQIEQASRVFPDEPVPPPSSESLEVSEQQMRERVLTAETSPV